MKCKRFMVFSLSLVLALCFWIGCTRVNTEKVEAQKDAADANKAASDIMQEEGVKDIADDIKIDTPKIDTPEVNVDKDIDSTLNEVKEESMPDEPEGVGEEEFDNDL